MIGRFLTKNNSGAIQGRVLDWYFDAGLASVNVSHAVSATPLDESLTTGESEI